MSNNNKTRTDSKQEDDNKGEDQKELFFDLDDDLVSTVAIKDSEETMGKNPKIVTKSTANNVLSFSSLLSSCKSLLYDE